MMRFLCLLTLSCLTTACASSPFVGHWQADSLPADAIPDGVETSTMVINKDGTFGVMLNNAEGGLVTGLNGTWTSLTDKQIQLLTADGDEGTATLMDKDTLLAGADGVAVRFERQK